MSKFREEMRKARAVLHRDMGSRAFVFAWPPEEDEEGNPLPVDTVAIKVRVHSKFQPLGDLKGTNYHYAEMEDDSPRAVFWLNDPDGFAPEQGLYFVTEYGEYYRIGVTHPKDDQTQNADVTLLLERETLGMPKVE